MKTEELKELGLSQEQINAVMKANGADINALKKANSDLENEIESLKSRAENAEATLEKYSDIKPEDVEALKKDIETYKAKADEAERTLKEKLKERDYSDALEKALENVKFSSISAKKQFMADIKAENLSMKNGKIMGLEDYISEAKKSDPTAFIDEKQQQLEYSKAKFTKPIENKGNGTVTKESIMSIKNDAERVSMIAQHKELFQ